MKTRQSVSIGLALLIGLLGLTAGCASSNSSFVRDDVDFSYIRRVAVFPFYNLSQDVHASQRLHSIFISEVLNQDALVLLELGETLHTMTNLRLSAEGRLSAEQIQELGKALKVDGIFFGTIEEYGVERVGDGRTYSVTASYNLVETETGSMVWNAQVRTDGASVWRSLFGGGSASLYDVSRDNVAQALDTLF